MPAPVRLTRDLTQPIPAPVWPAGVDLVPFSATLAPKVHRLMQLAYASGGGSVPADFDAWWAMTRHDAEFDATLCFVAAVADEPVGFILCWTSAFLKEVVIHPDHQGKGIGTALLRTALWTLADRDHAEAALKVHADNGRARRLYAAAGFR